MAKDAETAGGAEPLWNADYEFDRAGGRCGSLLVHCGTPPEACARSCEEIGVIDDET